jgi:hypothetical protein
VRVDFWPGLPRGPHYRPCNAPSRCVAKCLSEQGFVERVGVETQVNPTGTRFRVDGDAETRTGQPVGRTSLAATTGLCHLAAAFPALRLLLISSCRRYLNDLGLVGQPIPHRRRQPVAVGEDACPAGESGRWLVTEHHPGALVALLQRARAMYPARSVRRRTRS